MKGQNFQQLYESLGPRQTYGFVVEGLNSGEVKPEDFSLKELAIAICGRQWYEALDRSNSRGFHNSHAVMETSDGEGNGKWVNDPKHLLEAGEGVDVSAFSAITGQLFFNKIREGWVNADIVSDSLFTNYPTKLDGEKIPWISHVFTQGDTDIHAGLNYPEAVFGPRYITTPRCTKQGHIVSLTKEAIFFDLTGQMLKSAKEVAWALRYNKEYRCLKVFLGLVNNYNLNGTSFNTYLSSGTNYVNSQSGTPLVDWTSINQAHVLFTNILDPDTGRPIIPREKCLFVMPYNEMTARRIVNATMVRSTYPGFASTGATAPVSIPAPGNVQFESANPLTAKYDVYTSPIAYQLLVQSGLSATQANNYWFFGDFKEAFWYAENWPFETFQAPAQNIKEFESDVVMRWKVSERGTPIVVEPRYVTQLFLS
jgi:hypothetical protein